jgi:hypothetical protein
MTLLHTFPVLSIIISNMLFHPGCEVGEMYIHTQFILIWQLYKAPKFIHLK